ncbi:hypothetical protein BDV97DRAFT_380200 [Delphinella strobiligena]|nr:hypothetical protein BDV97DRAFT_380200 [Delphinella strobiligena]
MLPTGLAILDHEAEALFVNHAFHELTVHGGLDKSFKKWPKTIHPDDYERVMKAYREAFEARSNLSTELFLMRPIGDEDIQHSHLRRHGGFICAVIARDAQERKTQQERFIDMISHEIRNPLSAVLHCQEDVLEAVHKENIPMAEIVEACETIALCVSYQKTLVDDILSFSKLDASMLSLPELRKRQIGFDYKIDPSYDKYEIGRVMADLVRISQVLVNSDVECDQVHRKEGWREKNIRRRWRFYHTTDVISSGCSIFESEGHVNTMDSTQSSDWGNGEALYILVAIRDTGIGINKENQLKLFDRFRQATPKTEEMYGGTGLGLNISRKICQLHGGSGSTFGFYHKVRRCEDQDKGDSMDPDELRNSLRVPDDYTQGPISDKDQPDMLTDPRVEATSNADNRWENTAEITSDMRKDKSTETGNSEKGTHRDESALKVLFVEDNLISQRILKRKMQAKGFEVITANNGKEAVDAFRSAASTESEYPAFDCVLMDQEMPVMDGNSATRAIRDIESKNSLHRIRIIGVTANVREEQQQQMRDAGMDSVLSKPFTINDLVDRVRKVANKS